MKRFLSLISLAAVLLMSCTQEYDDSALKEKIDALSSQVAKCVQQVNELNTQVQGLNAVIEQWKSGGFVQNIQEITGGYTITFVGGQTVTLYNGKDGKDGTGTPGADGHSPVVSVKADADGQLYWAVDDEFLLDAQGNKVPVSVTPSFRINDAGELIVTIGGVDKNLGLVKGAGNSIFESVVPGDETVVFTLVTGISFEIPMVKAFKLVIDTKNFSEVTAGQQIAIPYTVQNGQGATVMAFAGGMYKASVDETAGKINVTVPTPASDGQIMAWAQTETVVSPIIILSFTVAEGQGQGGEEPAAEVVIVSQPETYQTIPMAGGEVAVSLTSNVDIVVEQPSVDWVSAILTKADYTLILTLAENTGAPRSTVLKINRADNGETVQRIQIAQLGTETVDPTALSPVTETTSWAATFTKGIATYNTSDTVTEVTSDFIMDNLGFVAGGGKFKFGTDGGQDRVQLGGTGVAGTKNCVQFMVAGSGVLTVLARSSGDATTSRPVKVAVGTTEVYSQVLPDKTLNPLSCEVAITAASGDLVNIYSGSSAINIYDIKWVPGGSVDPQNPDDPTPSDGAELECTTPPTVGTVELDRLYGYGAAVTGGAGASSTNVLHFNNGKALQTWLLARTKSEKNGDHSPVIIWLSGTFKPDDGRDFSEAHPWFDVKDVSNLSFFGTDDFVMDRIGIFCVRAKNIVIRNINFQQPKANNGADAVSMQECDGVWVDHCTFTSLNQTKDYEDGSTDITHESKNVTVSWCRYIKTQKSCLVGHSNSASADAAITATFHHNWFDQSSSRHPRVRFGKAHVYNNLFDGCTTYGVGSAYGAKVLVEYNYFDGVQLPTDICTYPAKENGNSNLQGSVAGYLYPTQNIYVNRPSKAKDPYPLSNVQYTKYGGTAGTALTYADFKPSYDYTVTAAADVPSVVKEGAGYGKLGWTSAPVAVNNGGITEFNGTDDDPVDPDVDDPDDSGDTSATGLADGWSWINNGATATYALSEGQLSIASTGKWESGAQTFGAVYREFKGDFTATVQLVSYNPQKDSNQGVGGLIVFGSDPSETANNLIFAIGGGKYGNFRASAGVAKAGFTLGAPATSGSTVILKMVREGNSVKLSYSNDGGETFGNVSNKEFTSLPETVKLGLAVNSGDNSKQSTAVFSNFTVNETKIAF